MTTSIVRGILAIWHDLDPGSESDFQEWHTREHMLERLSVPGFQRGCRYAAVNAASQVFNYYLTETPDVLTSSAYLARLNDPTDWTVRVVPTLRNVNRSAGRVVASVGAGQGGAIATQQLSPLADKLDDFEELLTVNGALQQLQAMAGIVAVHLWRADTDASGIETAESRARGSDANVSDWTVAIEGNELSHVQPASEWLQGHDSLRSMLQSDATIGIYRLQHHLNSPVAG